MFVFPERCICDLGVYVWKLLGVESNLSRWNRVKWKLFDFFFFFLTNPRFMSNTHCFSKITAYNFPSWQCIKSYLNAVHQRTDRTVRSLQIITLSCLSLGGAVNVVLSCSNVFFFSVFIHDQNLASKT